MLFSIGRVFRVLHPAAGRSPSLCSPTLVWLSAPQQLLFPESQDILLSSAVGISLSSFYWTSPRYWIPTPSLSHSLLLTFTIPFSLYHSHALPFSLGPAFLCLTSTWWNDSGLSARFFSLLILSSWMSVSSFMALDSVYVLVIPRFIFSALRFTLNFVLFCASSLKSAWMSEASHTLQIQNGAFHFHSPGLFLSKPFSSQ